MSKYASFLNTAREDIIKARISEHTVEDSSSDSDAPTVKRSNISSTLIQQFEGIKALFLVRDEKDQLMTIGSGWLHIQNFVKGGGEIVEHADENPTHFVCLPDMSNTKSWTLEEVAKKVKKDPDQLLARRAGARVYCVNRYVNSFQHHDNK